MTFLQRTLGRNYKWFYVFQFGFKASVTYRSSAIIWTLLNLLVIFATVLIWWINIDAGSRLFDFKTIFTYYIFGSLIAIGHGVHWNVSEKIKNGTLSQYLITPSNVMFRSILGDFSWWFFQNSIQLLSLCLAAFFGRDYIITSSPSLILLYILCTTIGYLISVFFAYALGSLAFFFTDVHGIMDIQTESKTFLSGKALPLDSVFFLRPLVVLPFAFTFHHPIQIYLGKYDYLQILQTFAGGILWCFVLWVLARWTFKLGLKKNEAVGL